MITVVTLFASAVCGGGQDHSTVTSARLTVQVINGTTGGSSVAGDEVAVGVYHHSQEIDTLRAIVDAEGKAVFENVITGEHVLASPRARHQGMSFNGRVVELRQGAESVSAVIEVYDVSDDASQVAVGTHHMVVKAQEASLIITEYMQLRNPTEMAITSSETDALGKAKVVEVKLPLGFKDLECLSYFQYEALVVTEDGFYDAMAIPPGEFTASFSYSLDITAETMEIVRKLSSATDEFMVFSQLGPGKLTGLGQAQGTMTLSDGVSAEYFPSASHDSGDCVTFQIAGLDLGSSNRKDLVIAGVVVVLILGLVAIGFRRKGN